MSRSTPTPCSKFLFIVLSISILSISAVLFIFPNPTAHDHHLSTLCHSAVNPESCRAHITEAVSGGLTQQTDAITVLQNLLVDQMRHMNAALKETRILKNQIKNGAEIGPLFDCLELIDLSIDLVFNSFKSLVNQTAASHADVQAWLSGVLTNHVTCFEGIDSRISFGAHVRELISKSRTSLAVLAAISVRDDEIIRFRNGKFPSWMTLFDRKLLQATGKSIKADLIVAKDDSGNFTTVGEAIAAAPNKSKRRYVIYVKKGVYTENVEIVKNKKNLMIIGDGMDSTIITSDLNVVDGSTTFRSATVAAVGEGIILQDMCIQNTAGPEKHQAVALRVGADKSVINRCKIDAFQDTLYAHSLRQFYKDCNITGTVDFIFGNAAVVFQKCKLLARKPMRSQKNMVTAQGRIDPNQNTGTSLQDCEIQASKDLEPVKKDFPTYLGRPWKEYSRTVVLQSYIGDVIDPAGWSEWSGDFALNTLYYGEYMNRGPGAGTGKRVNWTGFHVIKDGAEAMQFTVRGLIQGSDWLDSTGVEYIETL